MSCQQMGNSDSCLLSLLCHLPTDAAWYGLKALCSIKFIYLFIYLFYLFTL